MAEGFSGIGKKGDRLEGGDQSQSGSLKLETGDLVVDVKKLNRESSFVVESELGVAGIRGTQFGLSADAGSTELAVLEEGLDSWMRIKKPRVWRALKRLQVLPMERVR